MEVLVYTFRTKDGGIIVCLDANKDDIIIKIIGSIESNWLNGGCDSQNGNIIIKLFNGDYFGFNPSSFNNFLCTKFSKDDVQSLAQGMYDGSLDTEGCSIVGIDIVVK